MTALGNMLWRIGELLELDQQLAWTRDAGFDGVAFHAHAGVPGKWRGVEPAACDAAERARLRQTISAFSFSEIHAPFEIELRNESLPSDMARLTPVLEFARDLDVGTVTVHAQLRSSRAAADPVIWQTPMQELDRRARNAGVTVVLEITDGFDAVVEWGLPNVGINLDVGHMYCEANRDTLTRLGGIAGLIRHLGSALRHLHLHDVDRHGSVDHIEIGTGIVEFDQMATALRDINYSGNATLELNPDRVSPAGIRRSAEYMRNAFRQAEPKRANRRRDIP